MYVLQIPCPALCENASHVFTSFVFPVLFGWAYSGNFSPVVSQLAQTTEAVSNQVEASAVSGAETGGGCNLTKGHWVNIMADVCVQGGNLLDPVAHVNIAPPL